MSFNVETAKMRTLYKVATHLGIDYKLPISKSALIELLKPALEEEDVDLSALEGEIIPAGHKEGRVKIVIHESSDPNAINPVFVGFNGIGYAIKRGEAVEVPRGVVGILENAKETVYDKTFDDKGAMILKERQALSYPFSIVE